jgi:hypothetical protein
MWQNSPGHNVNVLAGPFPTLARWEGLLPGTPAELTYGWGFSPTAVFVSCRHYAETVMPALGGIVVQEAMMVE